jgi:BASS family bile acid:Na+ symporter
MLGAFLALLARRATLVLPGCVLIGLLFPPLAALLRPTLTPLVLLILVVAMIRTDWPALRHLASRPGRVAFAMALVMVLLGLAVAVIARHLGLEPGLALAVSLMCFCPPITSAPAFAPLLGLNQALCLVVAVAGLLIVPLTLPPLALQLLDLPLDIGVGALMARLAGLIGIALAIAVLFRVLLRRHLARLAPAVDGAGVVMLIVFAIAIFDGVTAQILADPARVGVFVLASFGAHVTYQAIAIACSAWLGRRDALTVGFLAGTRNVGLLLAVLPASTDPAVFLYIATAQFPIYIMPTVLRPVYARLLARPG